MKSSTILTTGIIILVSLTTWTCKMEELTCPAEEEFCSLVDKQDFEGTGPIIDDYLVGLDKTKPNGKLDKLVNWLECKSCVDNAKVLCNSCIETLPPQSELRVDFTSSGNQVSKTLDILMSDPLEYSRYHD